VAKQASDEVRGEGGREQEKDGGRGEGGRGVRRVGWEGGGEREGVSGREGEKVS
jgi:hypothetical protein